MRTPVHLLVTTVLLVSVSAARAQIDSPPPALMGQSSYHLYSVPFAQTGGNRAFFACTNTTSQAIRVGVEGFSSAGGAAVNDASATSLNVAPSGTVLFGDPAVGLSVNSALGG